MISKAKVRRLTTWLAATGTSLCLIIVLTHTLWLTAMAQFLVISNPPRQADAIIVLGGGTGDRERMGAALYRAGYAPEMLTTGETVNVIGISGTFAELSARQLELAGVPADHIHLLSTSSSTCDDARLSHEVLSAMGAHSLIVVSDPFHMRRAMMLFDHEYAGSGIELIPVAASPSWFNPDHWWRRERDLRVVAEEYIKLGYYTVTGCPGFIDN
jgi:uncharacterized SAM-binding protein YcdF (DUF218 family)